jgi:hypothetical protein
LIKAFKKNYIKQKEKIPNIMLLFIDSVSYLNFERHLPLMKSFVRKHGFYELKGYNKVGENTFPNFIPLLTGLFHTELATEYEIKNFYFDNWPIIWKNFSAKGFRTLFTEEMFWCGLFTHEKKGFNHKPTDYYLRPFDVNIRKQMYLDYCYNGKLETEVKNHVG